MRRQPLDPAVIVRRGYDAIGRRYLEAFSSSTTSPRLKYINMLLPDLRRDSVVLELGCGPGHLVTSTLADHCSVIAVDLSHEQLKLARAHAPKATLLQADMSRLEFAPSSFDAVVAFYSLTHVPRGLLAPLLHRVEDWLRPGGLLIATMGAGDLEDSVEPDWLGVPMFFSHFDHAANADMVRHAGLWIQADDVLGEMEHDDREVAFQWLVARKPKTDSTTADQKNVMASTRERTLQRSIEE